MKAFFIKLCLFMLLGVVRAQGGEDKTAVPEKKEVTMDSLDVKIDDAVKRLYSIEDKVDHLLFHHSHDVTPHNFQFTPFGPVVMPEIRNPKSAHTQMKTHDILRSGMMGGVPYGFNGYGGPQMQMPYQGYPPLF